MAHTALDHRIGSLRSAFDRLKETGHALVGFEADALGNLNQLLDRFESEASAHGVPHALARELDAALDRLPDAVERLEPEVRALADDVVFHARRLSRAVADSLEIPSRPLFGVLPIARLVPQDVHSIGDYVNGFASVGPVFYGDAPSARIASAILGTSLLGVSAITDYRLSFANVVPIEVHEALDYLWGASAIAAPFVFGYFKKSPIAAAMHIGAGLMTIAISLFTDYRAAKGIGHSKVAAAAMMGAERQPGISMHQDYFAGDA
jgi:hypothetical protein